MKKELGRAEPDLEKIRASMNNMLSAGNLSSYAIARYSLLELRVAIAFGNVDQQIEATKKLLMFENRVSEKNRALDAEILNSVIRSLFFSLISTQRYAEAMGLYAVIQEEEDESLATELSITIAKIQQLRQSDSQSVIAIDLAERGYSVEHLLKNSLAIIDVEGAITSLKFRCERKFKLLPFALGAEYRLPKSWGQCVLETVGKPGTMAKLVQY